MRRQGVRNLIAYCLNDACRHQAIIDVLFDVFRLLPSAQMSFEPGAGQKAFAS
jgi:hypothetical protein